MKGSIIFMFWIYLLQKQSKYLDRNSIGAFQVEAEARRLAVTFCLASRGRHPQSAKASIKGNT